MGEYHDPNHLPQHPALRQHDHAADQELDNGRTIAGRSTVVKRPSNKMECDEFARVTGTYYIRMGVLVSLRFKFGRGVELGYHFGHRRTKLL
jgi:hypothetical protein